LLLFKIILLIPLMTIQETREAAICVKWLYQNARDLQYTCPGNDRVIHIVDVDDLTKKRANFRAFKLSTEGAAIYQQWGTNTSQRFHQAASNLNAFLKTGACHK